MEGIDALKKAANILGSQRAVADAIGIKQPSVNQILKRGKKVPAEWCIPLERATRAKGTTVTRHQLRPDLFPEAEEARQ